MTLLAHTEMCDILSCKNVCEGVLIRDEEGKLIPVYARDVIWACGGIGGIYDNSTNFPHLTGDALAIAIHRNVALKNVNYVQIHPTTLYSQKKGRRFLISESVRGEGAVLLDKTVSVSPMSCSRVTWYPVRFTARWKRITRSTYGFP